MAYQARVLLDSISEHGSRLTTMELTFWRPVLAEFNTHRSLCLDGGTYLYFDLPSGRGKPGRKLYKLTIRQLYDKWKNGIERPIWRRHEYDSSKLEPERLYRTRELANLFGVHCQNITRLCRKEGLPYTAEGEGKQATFYVRGSDFSNWLSRRPISTFNVTTRLQKMALRCCNEETGEITYTTVTDVFESGSKPVFRITLEDGKSLLCSKDHRLLTEEGWMTLENAVGLSWSPNQILHWEKKAPRIAVNGTPAYADPEWLLQKRSEGHSAKDIAKLAGVSIDKVKYQIRKHDVGVQDLGLVLRRAHTEPWNKGRTYSNPKLKGKNGKPQPKGADSPLWKGGITPERALIGQWAQKVAPEIHKKNGFLCVLCGDGQRLCAHHIDPVYRNLERAYDITNLTTLCERCHVQIHARYLEEHFLQEYYHGSLDGFWNKYKDTRRPRPSETRPPGHVTVVRQWVRIETIEYVGVRDTYDIAVDGPWHNFVANGLIVHNSRNAASSRAIPVEKMLQRVIDDPAMPVWWGRNQKGMQAAEELSQNEHEDACREWLAARDDAVRHARYLTGIGLHKQLVNRLLEPWCWVTVIATATDWANFFRLRVHEDAQPEIRKVAALALEAYHESTPVLRAKGDWHCPLIQPDEQFDSVESMKRVSVGRCARVSYLTHDGKRDQSKDLELCDRLMSGSGGVYHMSPFEHVATPLCHERRYEYSGNLYGWHQFRKEIPNENRYYMTIDDRADLLLRMVEMGVLVEGEL